MMFPTPLTPRLSASVLCLAAALAAGHTAAQSQSASNPEAMGATPSQASAAGTQAALSPLGPQDTVQAETSMRPKITWLGKVETWDNHDPRSFVVQRGEGTVQTLVGGVRERISRLALDTHSFTTMGYTQTQAPEVVASDNTRPAGDLAPGMKWNATITYVSQPADWCPSDLKATHDSSFEVQPAETYTLRINGQAHTLPVLPVVERGTWRRCYTGKRYQRFLWSPDLQTVLAIEFQTFNPMGRLHEASFDMRAKAVQRSQP